MEKKGVISEFCIKIVFALFATIAIGFLIYDLIVAFPLFKALSTDEQSLYELINHTKFYQIYLDIGVVETLNKTIFFKIIVAFFSHFNFIEIIFLFLFFVLVFAYFIFIKWKFVLSYIKVSLLILMFHLFRFLINGANIYVLYNEEFVSLQKSIFIGNIFYVILEILEMFLLSLWIIKFIFNFEEDIKQIHLLNNN